MRGERNAREAAAPVEADAGRRAPVRIPAAHELDRRGRHRPARRTREPAGIHRGPLRGRIEADRAATARTRGEPRQARRTQIRGEAEGWRPPQEGPRPREEESAVTPEEGPRQREEESPAAPEEGAQEAEMINLR